MAGQQRGKEDRRHLWAHIARLVADIKPDYCVFENVPGIMQITGDDILSDLEAIGYAVGVWEIEAAAVGAPHRRARIFFVGAAERRRLSGQPRRRSGEIITDGHAHVADGDCPRELQPSGSFEEFGRRTGNSSQDVGDAKGIGGEHEAERICEALPDSTCERCGARRPESEGLPRESRLDGNRSNATNPDGELCGAISEGTKLGCTECCGRRELESRLGGMVNEFSAWLDRDWWKREPDIPRVARGIPDRVARLKALGNAVVPAQVYPIFRAIMEVTK